MADLTEIEDLIEQLEAPIDWAHFVRDDHAMDYQELHMRAASALRQLLSATEWKPIDAHSKDGNWFLGGWFFQGRMVYRLGMWNDRMQRFQEMPGCHKAYFEFFHPLPPTSYEGER
jgi:hypothetical protein